MDDLTTKAYPKGESRFYTYGYYLTITERETFLKWLEDNNQDIDSQNTTQQTKLVKDWYESIWLFY